MISALWSQFEGQSIENSFQLKQLIGVGGFGGVFLADHVVEGRFVRRVAVKLLLSQPESFERQLGELITATTLQHPHLLRCFHAGSVTFGHTKLLYLVMEIAEESLETRLKKLRLPAQEAIVLTQDIASALAFLHQQKLVHRDLKPGNILRVGQTWKLSDFGTVRQSAGGATSHTEGLTGTIAYMPPESFDGTVSPAWDMWSLGVLVLEALTGQTPFGDAAGRQLMRAILTEDPIIPPDLPQPFGEIVRGCFTKEYRERWSAQRVIEALRKHWLAEEAERTAAGRQAAQEDLPPRWTSDQNRGSLPRLRFAKRGGIRRSCLLLRLRATTLRSGLSSNGAIGRGCSRSRPPWWCLDRDCGETSSVPAPAPARQSKRRSDLCLDSAGNVHDGLLAEG
jgi:serine/threonine protein kinase